MVLLLPQSRAFQSSPLRVRHLNCKPNQDTQGLSCNFQSITLDLTLNRFPTFSWMLHLEDLPRLISCPATRLTSAAPGGKLGQPRGARRPEAGPTTLSRSHHGLQEGGPPVNPRRRRLRSSSFCASYQMENPQEKSYEPGCRPQASTPASGATQLVYTGGGCWCGQGSFGWEMRLTFQNNETES